MSYKDQDLDLTVEDCEISLALANAGAFVSGASQSRMISTVNQHNKHASRPEWMNGNDDDEEGPSLIDNMPVTQSVLSALENRLQYVDNHFNVGNDDIIKEAGKLLGMVLDEMTRVRLSERESHEADPFVEEAWEIDIDCIRRAKQACDANKIIPCCYQQQSAPQVPIRSASNGFVRLLSAALIALLATQVAIQLLMRWLS